MQSNGCCGNVIKPYVLCFCGLKDGMYITKSLSYIVKMNILENKGTREIILYNCFLVLCDMEKKMKHVHIFPSKKNKSTKQ